MIAWPVVNRATPADNDRYLQTAIHAYLAAGTTAAVEMACNERTPRSLRARRGARRAAVHDHRPLVGGAAGGPRGRAGTGATGIEAGRQPRRRPCACRRHQARHRRHHRRLHGGHVRAVDERRARRDDLAARAARAGDAPCRRARPADRLSCDRRSRRAHRARRVRSGRRTSRRTRRHPRAPSPHRAPRVRRRGRRAPARAVGCHGVHATGARRPRPPGQLDRTARHRARPARLRLARVPGPRHHPRVRHRRAHCATPSAPEHVHRSHSALAPTSPTRHRFDPTSRFRWRSRWCTAPATARGPASRKHTVAASAPVWPPTSSCSTATRSGTAPTACSP